MKAIAQTATLWNGSNSGGRMLMTEFLCHTIFCLPTNFGNFLRSQKAVEIYIKWQEKNSAHCDRHVSSFLVKMKNRWNIKKVRAGWPVSAGLGKRKGWRDVSCLKNSSLEICPSLSKELGDAPTTRMHLKNRCEKSPTPWNKGPLLILL